MDEVFAFTVTVHVEAPTRSAQKVLDTMQELLDEHTFTVQPDEVLSFVEARSTSVLRTSQTQRRIWVVKRDACYLDTLGTNRFSREDALEFDNLRAARQWAEQWPGTRIVRLVPKRRGAKTVKR